MKVAKAGTFYYIANQTPGSPFAHMDNWQFALEPGEVVPDHAANNREQLRLALLHIAEHAGIELVPERKAAQLVMLRPAAGDEPHLFDPKD